MEPTQKEGRAFSISMAVVFLSLIGVALVQQLPLTPTRPDITGQKEQNAEMGMVQARLWQDPFAAVARHRERENVSDDKVIGIIKLVQPRSPVKSSVGPGQGLPSNRELSIQYGPRSEEDVHHRIGTLQQDIRDHLRDSKKITVLSGMLFGGPYEDQSELRRRWRYAVVSALAESGYVPEKHERIEYFTPEQTQPGPWQSVVPYEWFEQPGQNAPVLLLWLNDDQFASAKRPLDRLLRLLTAVAGRDTLSTGTAQPQLEFKILGPAGTTTLSNMVNELDELSNTATAGKANETATTDENDGSRTSRKNYIDRLTELGGLEFYSATATADDCQLLHKMPGCKHRIADVFSRFNRASPGSDLIKLTRTINTDSDLAQIITEELKLRGAISPAGRSHVVLISEWDTQYGRALPQVMAQQFTAVAPELKITKFSYLRGLDGSLPANPGKEKTNGGASPKNTDNFDKERPVGTSRFDYLRRLVGSIERLDELAPGYDKVRAIGVLGSDVYDKQLVLQALRPVFPNVHFFTTDLDARLLHPADFRWNRNLIVGSGYGLELHRQFQGRIPPFRSGYQTALFLSGQMALDYRVQLPRCLKPRVFEVGRTGAFDLTGSLPFPKCADFLNQEKNIVRLNPAPPAYFPGAWTWWQAGGLLLAILVIVYYTSSAVKDVIHDSSAKVQHPRLVMLTMAAGLVLALYLFVHFVGGALAYEPFVLFNGISAWPGILLNVLAFALAVFFILLSLENLDNSRRHLDRRINFRSPTAMTRDCRVAAATENPSPVRIDEISVYRWHRGEATSGCSGEQLWLEYRERGRRKWRFFRIAPPLLIYFIVVSWILITTEYHIPVRGDWAHIYTIAINFAAFFAMSLLTFIVVDASRLCRRFIQLLSAPNIRWSEQTKNAFMETRDEARPRDEWISLQVISERANKVAKLIIYPFFVLLILIVSRLSYFDNWNTPMGIALIYFTLAIYAFVSVFILHRAAERARSRAIDSLEDKLVRAYQDNRKTDEYRVLIDRIRGLREGAFRPMAEQPVIKTLLLPFGGGAGLLLLDYLDWLR